MLIACRDTARLGGGRNLPCSVDETGDILRRSQMPLDMLLESYSRDRCDLSRDYLHLINDRCVIFSSYLDRSDRDLSIDPQNAGFDFKLNWMHIYIQVKTASTKYDLLELLTLSLLSPALCLPPGLAFGE